MLNVIIQQHFLLRSIIISKSGLKRNNLKDIYHKLKKKCQLLMMRKQNSTNYIYKYIDKNNKNKKNL